MSTSSETYPLDGVTVIDFSRLLPGPWCTQMLGDLGAVVIKVEEPKLGDASRYNPPLYQQSSVYYNSVNGNKKSITLDLRTKAGQCIAHRLMESADVVVESQMELEHSTQPSGQSFPHGQARKRILLNEH